MTGTTPSTSAIIPAGASFINGPLQDERERGNFTGQLLVSFDFDP
ncbi:MAG: hypothetical protein R3253_09970 [Longimicrobiales bacterium]|nr:hypothetical protein [Longimicrobiales bacterium]